METNKLTREEQEELLRCLFGFEIKNESVVDGDEHWVIYDDDGNEFYGSDENCQFDLSTIEGMFTYARHKAYQDGCFAAKLAIQKAIGI